MPFRTVALAALVLLIPTFAFAQTPPVTSLKGKFRDVTTNGAVPGVQVKLTSFADTADIHRVTAGDDGAFEIKGLGVHSYRLEATRVGYETLKQIIRVTRDKQDVGVLGLTPQSVDIPGVTVTESPAPAVVKGDTTEFRASAVKTHKDATAEDLVQKLPGVTIENGTVKAQGQDVQNVLVNGRPFFGSDPTAAMRNLPADVVDRVQVYDRGSDQSEFSGFDDGTAQKTMNFILRDQKAKFGKVYGGYGDEDRYQAGVNASLVRGGQRVTGIGMSNNINQRNFSPQDLLGVMTGNQGGGGAGGPRMMMFGGGGGMRPGGGGGGNFVMRGPGGGFGGGAFDPSSFLVGNQAGITTTHSGGVNYVGQWGRTLQVSSSLFLNDTDSDNRQLLNREYIPPQDSIQFYDQAAISDTRNGNQRFDMRMEWTPDSTNSVIFQPRLYFQQNDTQIRGTAANITTAGEPLSAALGTSRDQIDGDNLSGRLTLRHRFAKKGRNVSMELNSGHNTREGDGTQLTVTDNAFGDSTVSDTLDQISDTRSVTTSYSTRIALTEPLSRTLQLQAIYNPSLSLSESDARVNRFDPSTGAYTHVDSVTSNTFENQNTVQNGGLAALLTKGPWKLLGNTYVQRMTLESDQTFPGTVTVDKTFDGVLPGATLTGTFSNRRNLRIAYSTGMNAPSISQLQNVVNNSNPLALTAGNPELRPTRNQNLSVRWSEADPMKSKSRFAFANLSRTAHPIVNETFTALSDTTIGGVFLARGTQLTRPINLDESWNGNLFAVSSMPVKKLKSILSLNGGGSLNHNPTVISGVVNRSRTYALRAGATLASNISPNLDFTFSYQGTYNILRSSLSTANDAGDYYSHNIALRFNSVISKGIVFRQELSNGIQSGVPASYGQNFVLWNLTVGKKFLKNDMGEIRVTATDVLDQNKSVNRSVTDTYVQDSRDQALGQYFQGVVSWSFR